MEGRKDNMPQLYTLISIDSLFCQKKLDVAIKQVKKKKNLNICNMGGSLASVQVSKGK